MKLVLALAVLVFLALARPAEARVVGQPDSLRLAALELMPKKLSLLSALGFTHPLDFGGGDGIVSGPTRTLGWIALGVGAGTMAVGGAMMRGAAEGDNQGLVLIGGGGVLAILGLGLIWATGCVSCASCGIVDNTPHQPPVARDAFAGLDVKRKPDGGGRKVTVFSMQF